MTPKHNKPPDDAARREAARRFDVNIVVQAGAGTGKTSLLVERILVAVGLAKVEIDGLAAITFTQKAAGEMRQRVAAGFERLLELSRQAAGVELLRQREADRAFEYLTAEAEVAREEIGARALAALRHMDRATIETIHTFCSSLIRAFPMEAGVDPSFEVDQGEHYPLLLQERWELFLQRELGRRAARAGLWRELLAAVPLGEMEKAARELAAFSVPAQLLATPRPGVSAARIFEGEIRGVREEIEDILDRQDGMTEKTQGILRSLSAAFALLLDEGLRSFQEHISKHEDLAQRVRKGNAPGWTKSIVNVKKEELEPLGKKTLRLAKELLQIDDELIAKTIAALAPFAMEAREAFLRSGRVGFDGLLALARDLLRDHTGVREALKSRFGMLLVDEFQDTDPLQYEIVLFLGEVEGGRSANAYEAALQPGRLFIVGDAKQSIYRFRGADYEAFSRAVGRIVESGGLSLELTTNFRSLPDLLTPINALFEEDSTSSWFPSAYQPSYVPITSLDEDDGTPCVELWTVADSAAMKVDERRRLEGEVIAEQIEALGPDYSRITILMRAFSDLQHYLRPLRRRAIPYIVDGGRGFMERQEVVHLIAVLRTLARPADQAALLAFLRSPAAGVSDRELSDYRAAGGMWEWRDEAPLEAAPRIAAAFELLRTLERETRDAPPDEVVRRTLKRTGLLSLSGAAFEGAQRVANLRKLVATAGSMARDGRLSLSEVLDNLQEEQAPEVESESPLADEKTNAVRVLTIHKAKGLENDVIIVPDLARERRTGDKQPIGLALLPEGRNALALRVGGIPNAARVWLDLHEERHLEAEDYRLLYVAMTRARSTLILVGGPAGAKATWMKALAPWDEPPDRADVVHRTLKPAGLERRSREQRPKDAAWAVRAYDEAVAAVREAAVAPFESPSATHEEAGPRMAEQPLRRDLGMAVGGLMHRLLERWNGKDERRLRERLVELASSAELKREAEAVLDAFLASPLAARFREIEIIGREVPMLMRSEEGQLYRGSIDLLYRDGEGRPVVADYKSDSDADETQLRERYGEQLRIYATAIGLALEMPDPPRAELWMLRSGKIIDVTVEDGR
jgi:ATP-dependent helicase/nuclease subunit A